MSKLFKFSLSSPDAVLYDGEVEIVSVSTPDGEISILANHEQLVSLIAPGVMTIKGKDGEKTLATGSGFIKVVGGKAKAFAQTAEFAESIDEQRAIEAKKQAESVMAQKTDEVSIADATGLLERNIARLKVIERKKRKHPR